MTPRLVLPAHGGPNPGLLSIPVVVLDTRSVYGRDESLISPVGGDGEAWIATRRLIASTEIPEADPLPLSDAETPA